MNKKELLNLYSPEQLTEEVIKISGDSVWKCRLCAYSKTGCNFFKRECKKGIKKFFTDEVKDNE